MGLFSRKETPQAPVYRAWADEPVLRGRTTNMRADGYDPAVVFITLGLLAMGALMVYSASISLADSPRYNTTQYHFLLRHLSSIALGIVAAYAVCRIPMRVWYKLAPWLMAAAVLFLVAVLVPGVGKSVNGSRRWINLGLMNLQVTEFAKFAILLGAAAFTVRRQDYMHSFSKGLGPMALVMCMVAGLISLQPDLGAIMVTVAIAMGVLFLGGLNLRIFVVVSIAVVAVVTLMIYDSPWRLQRVMAYLDPWSSDYALNKAYQLSHSLIAFGRGELLGVGLGASVEKLHYLPEAHTDFILAVLGEELGFVGVTGVLIGYYCFVRRAFAIGRQAIKLDRVFSGLVAEGVGIWIGIQVVINAGVATGLLPTKGLTLPLTSYGGSSLLFTLAAVGLLLRVDRENRILMRGGKV